MSPRYRYHPGTRLALLQVGGTLTLEGWEAAAREILAIPEWGGTRRILSDRRRMPGTFPRGIEDRAVEFFRENAAALGEVQWGVVVPNDLAAFATVRVAAELSKDTRVRVQGFTDLAVALQWLVGVHDRQQIAALTHWIDQTE